MNINEFIGEKADKKMSEISYEVTTYELDPTETEFVTFRANQNGLD